MRQQTADSRHQTAAEKARRHPAVRCVLSAVFTMLLAAAADAQQYIGVASCANSGCHGATTSLQSTRVRQNEYFTWLHSDRHAAAYNVLFNPLSARIAKNMHLGKKPYQEKLCLDCHSTNIPPQM